MVETLTRYNKGQLLSPWQHGVELHEAVFWIAATFPLRYLKHKRYMIPGDEHFGFDPNAFVQRLVEETGISHVWGPISIKVSGGRLFSYSLVVGRQGRDPDAAAFFANLLLDNIDLVRQLEASLRDRSAALDPLLPELERRAQHFPGSG